MVKIYKTICFLLIILLTSCSSDDRSKEKNCIDKAVSISKEDLDKAYSEGQKDARADVENGVYAIKRWGMPPLEKQVNKLKEMYDIDVITVSGYFVSMVETRRIDGYNSVSMNEIRKKHGDKPFEIIKYVKTTNHPVGVCE
jgi:hypothetical protein